MPNQAGSHIFSFKKRKMVKIPSFFPDRLCRTGSTAVAPVLNLPDEMRYNRSQFLRSDSLDAAGVFHAHGPLLRQFTENGISQNHKHRTLPFLRQLKPDIAQPFIQTVAV